MELRTMLNFWSSYPYFLSFWVLGLHTHLWGTGMEVSISSLLGLHCTNWASFLALCVFKWSLTLYTVWVCACVCIHHQSMSFVNCSIGLLFSLIKDFYILQILTTISYIFFCLSLLFIFQLCLWCLLPIGVWKFQVVVSVCLFFGFCWIVLCLDSSVMAMWQKREELGSSSPLLFAPPPPFFFTPLQH